MYKFGPTRSPVPLSPRPSERRQPQPAYDDGYTEPCLSEVLMDPIVHAVMARDSVTTDKLVRHILAAREALQSRVRKGPNISDSQERRAA